eukprot:12928433-Prorocentrum_lima.AAC.1
MREALEEFTQARRKDLAKLVESFERRLQVPLDALQNHHKDLQNCSKSRKGEGHKTELLRVAKAAKLTKDYDGVPKAIVQWLI